MKRAALIVLMLGAVAMGQATQPSAPTVDDLKASMASLERRNAKLISENENLKKEVAALKAERDKLAAQVKAATPVPSSEKIAAAIKAHEIVLGMTRAEAEQAFENKGEVLAQREGVELIRIQYLKNGGSTTREITLRDGKVVQIMSGGGQRSSAGALGEGESIR